MTNYLTVLNASSTYQTLNNIMSTYSAVNNSNLYYNTAYINTALQSYQLKTDMNIYLKEWNAKDIYQPKLCKFALIK